MAIVLEDGESTPQYFGRSSAGSFLRQIKAAIDGRLGVPTTKVTSADQPPRSHSTARGQDDSLEYTLPPRRTADRLVDTYWLYADSLYPFLDREKWEETYEGIFAGTPITVNERIFVTTLNVMFALSTQLIESLHPDHRHDSSKEYFHRAQDLLRLNIWDPGSVELVQCLLLMGQYLQSTDDPHQTWMVVGSAVRTAQGIGLHLPDTSAALENPRERELLRRLWHGCVLMDRYDGPWKRKPSLSSTNSDTPTRRMVSVTHGRPAIISLESAPQVPLPLFKDNPETQGTSGLYGPSPDNYSRIAFFAVSVELYEIINRTSLAFYSGELGRTVGDKNGPGAGPPDDAMEDLGTVMELDESLSEWEQRLPSHLHIERLSEMTDLVYKRQAVILRVR
jgi:hypothetical protein